MNKKGFTVVELIVSFALTVLVVGLLFQMLLSLKEVYVASGFKSQMVNKQTIMSSKINQDLNNKTLKIALKCGDNCLNFVFEDGTNKKLIVDDKNNIFSYGDYSTKLVNGSEFGNFYIRNEKIMGLDNTSNYDSVIEIKIPINHPLLEEDYGVNMLYQYDSRTSSIADIIFDSSATTEDKIVFKGSSHMYHVNNTTFTDPGYYVYKSDGTVVDNSTSVTKSGSVGSVVGTTYVLVYTLKDGSNNVLDIATREVTVIKGLYEYDYTGNYQTFITPFDGTYQFEAWGAEGDGTTEASKGVSLGGNGAYTKGSIYLEKGTQLYIYIGEGGNLINSSNVGVSTTYNENFNGGGAGTFDTTETPDLGEHGFSGGGATDFRLVSGAWNDINSLRSRIIVSAGGGGGGWSGNGSADQYYAGGGGAAGTLNGFGPSGAATSTIGTQTTGYTFGRGGLGRFAAPNNNGTGGGGGGYYGGDSGLTFAKPNSSGSGGSSFVSGHLGVNAINASGVHTNSTIHYSGYSFFNTSMIAGNASMPNPRGIGNITGNTGDGYAKVTVLSVIDEYNGDTTPPVITLNGASSVSQYQNDSYTDAGVLSVIDNVDGDITAAVSMTSNVAISIPGTYQVTYTSMDANGNNSTVIRTVTINSDPIPTVAFSMNGNTTWAKARSTTVTVSDVGSGLNTSSLEYQWTTSTTAPTEASFTISFTNGATINTPSSGNGGYYLWILAKDNRNNTTIVRTNVFNIDNTAPVITLNGAATVSFLAGVNGSNYVDAGVTVTDNLDGSIATRLVTVNPVVDDLATYTVRYNVTDISGNIATEVTRTVNVVTLQIEYLVVAGGGGSGAGSCNAGVNAAGGAGGIRYSSAYTIGLGSYATTVGAGGATNVNGGNSSLGAISVATGGGRGGVATAACSSGDANSNGASGGSGGSGQSYFGAGYAGGAGIAGQGYAGAASPNWSVYSRYVTGGGGGAGGAGGAVGGALIPGNGGVGLQYSISGTPTYYAGGGAGQSETTVGTPGAGVIGRGGSGGSAGNAGVVIIRYYGAQKATGGTITSVGGYTIHTFTTSGTFTVN